MIYVIVTVELKPGRREDFLAEFRKIVPIVRAEKGCLEYGPHVDAETGIEMQQPTGGDVVTVIEKWESVESLQAHLVAPHMIEYRPKVKPMIERSTLSILAPT